MVPPVRRKAARERMEPKTSVATTVATFPLCTSGLRSSRRVPRETTISCVRDPEKLPATACVIAVGDWRVRLYKCMRKAAQSGRKAKQANDPKTALQETTKTLKERGK